MAWQFPALIIIALFGILANGLILISIIKYKILRKHTYSYLVSLAVCDSLKIIVIVNIIVYGEVDSYQDSVCIETGILGFTLMCCTTFHLAAESINRYLHVVWPYEYARLLQKKHLVGVIALLWILPLVFGVLTPLLWFQTDWLYSLHFHAKIFGCKNILESSAVRRAESGEAYVILMYVIFFAAPLLIMIVCYGLVLKTAYTVAKTVRESEVKKNPNVTSPAVRKTTFSNPVIEMVSATYSASVMSEELAIKKKIEHQSERTMSFANAQKEIKRKLKQRKREIKSSKTVLIMISAFLICNAPIFTLAWLTDSFDEQRAEDLLKIFLTLSQVQVFVNPLVYFLRLRDFRNARRKCRNVSRTIIRKTIRRM